MFAALNVRFMNVVVPRKTPEVRVMTFKRELEGVDCQSALFSLTLGVCGLPVFLIENSPVRHQLRQPIPEPREP